ncbi:MAG: hypothetical protein HOP19_21325 [Acidobacteria bacterium]|nr:hypothetical protein [Acidobacteriota bacterium]
MVASNNKHRNITYGVGDEVSYVFGNGIVYGEVTRLLEGGQAIEILFEDGRKEIKKSRDGALRLLRRATGLSEAQEENKDRAKSRDVDIADVMRGDMRRGSRP